MRARLLLLVVLAGVGAWAVAQAGAATSASPVTPCALGSLPAATRALETGILSRAATRFGRSLTGVSAAARVVASRRYATSLAAYLYGYPIVIVRRTVLTFPENTMVSIGQLATPAAQSIVAPNHDTLYSVARVDLSAGPIVIQTPATGGRYSELQLLDGFTNVTAYVGAGSAMRTGQTLVLAAPGWHGRVPDGLRVMHAATSLLWLLGRTLATGPADTAKAVALLKQYSVTPLQSYVTGARAGPLVLPSFPARQRVTVPDGPLFFDELGADLAADPVPKADRCALNAFRRVGIGPGLAPTSQLRGTALKALTAAARDGLGVIAQLVTALRKTPAENRNGWETTPPDTAQFGTSYANRAVVAKIGLGANTNATALYLSLSNDSKGRRLNGNHVYRLRFAKGQLPPARVFWSVTLYDRNILLYANPLDRYNLGNHSGARMRFVHGSLAIVVSHRTPPASERSNWLPAPAGPFELYLRLYAPAAAAVSGRWLPPSVVRLG